MVTSRRNWIGVAAAAKFVLLDGLFAAESWDKPISEWSDKDIEKLMNKSPWAKKATVDTGRGLAAFSGVTPGRAGGGGRGGGGPQGGAGADPGIDGGGDFGGGTAGGPAGGLGSAPEALVRWESALPVLEAQKRVPTELTTSNYIISVAGFPMGRGPGGPPPGTAKGGPPNPEAMRAMQQEMFERAKETTKLERKGRDPVHAAAVGMSGRALVIVFPRQPQPLQLEDKEVQLVVQVGLPILKIKFSLKDMVYRGRLEV